MDELDFNDSYGFQPEEFEIDVDAMIREIDASIPDPMDSVADFDEQQA